MLVIIIYNWRRRAEELFRLVEHGDRLSVGAGIVQGLALSTQLFHPRQDVCRDLRVLRQGGVDLPHQPRALPGEYRRRDECKECGR